jgi:hypothetical protein
MYTRIRIVRREGQKAKPLLAEFIFTRAMPPQFESFCFKPLRRWGWLVYRKWNGVGAADLNKMTKV